MSTGVSQRCFIVDEGTGSSHYGAPVVTSTLRVRFELNFWSYFRRCMLASATLARSTCSPLKALLTYDLSVVHNNYDYDVTVRWLRMRQPGDVMQHRAISCSQSLLRLRLRCNCDASAMWLRPEINMFIFLRGCTRLQPIAIAGIRVGVVDPLWCHCLLLGLF